MSWKKKTKKPLARLNESGLREKILSRYDNTKNNVAVVRLERAER